MEFAKSHINKPLEFWHKVIFSDENNYNLFGLDGAKFVWRKTGERMKPANMRPTVKHGGGNVLVWGCMAASGVENLHFIEGIMDRFMYRDILAQNLEESATNLGLAGDFSFQ